MDADRFPTGSRVEVYWPGDEEWFAAAVLKTRTMSHNIDGAQTLCREIFCYYDLDLHMQWHSLHEDDVRTCSTTSPADESGIHRHSRRGVVAGRFVCYYRATVLTTRAAWHSIQKLKQQCREVYVDYDLDGVMMALAAQHQASDDGG